MFKILGFILIVAILAPFGYFAWRAGQPISMPEYDGRTYYELLAERREAYATWPLNIRPATRIQMSR
jgi:hypothetical protein